jgi:4'-phosphopantetheinyl transferase
VPESVGEGWYLEGTMLADGEIDVWYARLSVAANRLATLRDTLSADERERAARFHFDRHRDAFVVARGVLRSILSGYFDVTPGEIVFQYGARGKPGIAGASIHFNASHSGDWAAYAVARTPLIGIDIEMIRPIPDMEELARRTFSEAEAAEFQMIDAPLRQQGFYNCWTRKEAYVKAIGDGLHAPLDGFQVTLSPGQAAALVAIDGSKAKAAQWTMFDLKLERGYAGAIVIYGTKWKIARTVIV